MLNLLEQNTISFVGEFTIPNFSCSLDQLVGDLWGVITRALFACGLPRGKPMRKSISAKT
jgi:hypothetical protein